MRAQFWCPNRSAFAIADAFGHYPCFPAVRKCGAHFCPLSCPPVSSTHPCCMHFIRVSGSPGRLVSPAQPGGIKAELNPLKFRCFHGHGGAQLPWVWEELVNTVYSNEASMFGRFWLPKPNLSSSFTNN